MSQFIKVSELFKKPILVLGDNIWVLEGLPDYGDLAGHWATNDDLHTAEHSSKDRIDLAMQLLTRALHEQLVFLKKRMTIDEWNSEIAPRLSELANAVQNVKISARTYRLHQSMLEDMEK